MKVTDVTIRKSFEDSDLEAIVSVTFNDYFVVHDIKIIKEQNNYYIEMPKHKRADGQLVNIASPTNPTVMQEITKAIIRAYQENAVSEDSMAKQD
ncbi:septation protein SpoVG [Heliobacillus mobilis]|uniref:Septation protein SpoVG n=1 Tax=Heliobacterium mobile TaxID=28064 RepID=A0A6I3SIG4_HELMO|nr:SpoVG family protein [Heliobacterium mobile]MTV48552.1 septation protein SpoVG [Heliobacterium mobile]